MTYTTTKSASRIGLLLAALTLFISTNASAGFSWYSYSQKLSEALEANGFGTLKYALDATGLSSVLDSNRVTLFAPTDDVFDATAEALGCTDALDLATRLSNIPVDDSNALVAVLTYHAKIGKINNPKRLLSSSPINTVYGESVTTGVNSAGLYVEGVANAEPSSITVEGWKNRYWSIYPIDTILLPFAPPADLCD